MMMCISPHVAGVDPEFPGPKGRWGRQPIILPNIAENCVKMGKNWTEGGGAHPRFYYVTL